MDANLDTLAASRKLEESGMPVPQADAVVEVVNDAVKDLVTKKYLTAELDRRFGDFKSDMDKRFGKIDRRFNKVGKRLTRLEAKIDTSVAELGKSQARGFASMSILVIAAVSLLFVALQHFGVGSGAAPGNLAEPPAFESGTAEPSGASPR